MIVESLEGKRTERVWHLIEKAVKKITGNKDIDLTDGKEEYIEHEEDINNESNRYVVLEHHNLTDGFYSQFFDDSGKDLKDRAGTMYDSYYSYDDGEPLLLVDMKEGKCYLVDRVVKTRYPIKEIKVK